MTDTPIITLALYAQTDVGMVRSGNEDNFLILDLSSGTSWTASEEEHGGLLTFNPGYYGSLLAVSDGMGGALAGEVASRMAVETVRDRMLQLQAHAVYGKLPFHERLRLAVEEANLLINRESGMNPEHKGLGATFTAVAIHGPRVYFAQVGDSRAHLIRQGRIARVTKDQSLVQQLIDAGQISEEEAETHSYRNVILQALGAHSSVNVEVNAIQLRQLDTLLLCSDGLSGKMREDEIASIVAEAPDLKSACQELISLANERGGEDNITVVIAQFSGVGLPAPDREPIDPEIIARALDTPTTINLSEGTETQPLNASESTPSPPDNAPPRVTGPIAPPPSPPSQSLPTVSKPLRNTPVDPVRTGDLPGRRGPITSVFAADDFEEDEQVTASLHQPQAAATAATAQRRTKPLEADAPETSTSEAPNSPTASPDDRYVARRARAPEPSGGPRFFLLLLGGLIILGLCIAAVWYYRATQQKEITQKEIAQQQIAERERQQEQQALQASINDLHDRIIVLKRSEFLANREDLLKRLGDLVQRLDETQKDAGSPDKFTAAKAAYDDIKQKFSSLESELNPRSGFPPHRFINQRPVAC